MVFMRTGKAIFLGSIVFILLSEVPAQKAGTESRNWERFASSERQLFNFDSSEVIKIAGKAIVWVQTLEREWHALHVVEKIEIDCRLRKSRSLAGVEYKLLRHQEGPPYGTPQEVEDWNKRFPSSQLPVPKPIVIKTGPPERTWDTPNVKFVTILPGTVLEALADTVCPNNRRPSPRPAKKTIPTILN